jgi:hypothetical protein
LDDNVPDASARPSGCAETFRSTLHPSVGSC